MPLGTFDRDENLALLGTGTFDVLVVGGGITGAGVALDAAVPGPAHRRWSSGATSPRAPRRSPPSWSTAACATCSNGEIGLVYEALHERQRLLRNAPHLVKVLPFLIPVFSGKGGIIPKQLARALGSAMWMYDLTGGLRIGKVHRRLARGRGPAHMPTLRRAAGLGLPLLRRPDRRRPAHARRRPHRGARLRCHGRQPRRGDRAAARMAGGCRARWSTAAGATLDVRARVVVNATGVWADDVRALDEGTHPDTIRPAKGIHIAVPWEKVRNDIAAVVPVPKDRRSIFVVPWAGAGGELGARAR